MREITCHCGSDPELIGIYTIADNHNERNAARADNTAINEHSGNQSSRPVILLLNSGLLPNVGPFRLYVRLARHFAQLGFDTFRFDLSGIGDSERRTDNKPRSEQQISDIKLTIDHLQKQYNANEFIVMGICTGADNAHRAMLADQRIVGAIGIDGYFYKTSRYYLNFLFRDLLPRLLQWETWRLKSLSVYKQLEIRFRHLFSVLGNVGGLTDSNGEDFKFSTVPVSVPYRWEVPDKDQTERDYREIIDRGSSMLCIFTASWPYNYTEQLADAFPDLPVGDNLQVHYLENSEHLFPLAQDREELSDVVTEWLRERFGDHR